MAWVLIDTHVLLWMLDGTLPARSSVGAEHVAGAIADRGVHVSVGSLLDLRYLVDAGRLPRSALDEVEQVVHQAEFSILPLDLKVHEAMGQISRDQLPDPFDRIIAATALVADLPLVTADRRIRDALGARAVW